MDEWELYDLESDPNELNNIYDLADTNLILNLKQKLDSLKILYNDTATIEEMKLMTDTVIKRVYNEPAKDLKN